MEEDYGGASASAFSFKESFGHVIVFMRIGLLCTLTLPACVICQGASEAVSLCFSSLL